MGRTPKNPKWRFWRSGARSRLRKYQTKRVTSQNWEEGSGARGEKKSHRTSDQLKTDGMILLCGAFDGNKGGENYRNKGRDAKYEVGELNGRLSYQGKNSSVGGRPRKCPIESLK